MCLLITQKATSPLLDDEQIADFYWYNSDGIGVMYSDGEKLHIKKALPKDSAQAIDFWRENVDGKDCAIHLRMRTHGDVSLENCHPYEVLPGLWLMHNGVLQIGNEGDKTKSDTWHYIERYLRPLLNGSVDLAFDPAFIEIISDHIGISNKFVMMDWSGRVAHFNYELGVEWNERWMSNRYAWTQPGEKRFARHQYRSSYLDKFDYGWEGGYMTPSLAEEKVRSVNVQFTADAWDEDDGEAPAIPVDFDVDEVLDYLDHAGLYKAASVSKNQAIAFAKRFGTNELWDLASMLDEGDIDEHQFIRFISDFRAYRETACGC